MQNAAIKEIQSTPSPLKSERRPPVAVLYAAAGTAAFTAIAYELLLASYTTFLLGASILQYSLVISLMMASMGIGSLLSRRWESSALQTFIKIEIVLAWVAAFAIPALYYSFYAGFPPYIVLILAVGGIGTVIGMEIPLLNHITHGDQALARLLFFDYFGGFVGGIAFPVILLPMMGFFKLAAVLSAVNAALAVALLVFFRKEMGNFTKWLAVTLGTLIFALVAYSYAEDVRRWMELTLFQIYDVTYTP